MSIAHDRVKALVRVTAIHNRQRYR
jgi:hypothetical protein